MYFQSRAEAGRLLAGKLEEYRYENVFVVCLSVGAVLVGKEIAAGLHASLALLMFDEIDVPGENQVYGTVNNQGGFSLNKDLGAGQADEYYGEFHSLIEQQKQERFHELNRILADGGLIERQQLQHYTIILVSDGLENGLIIDAAGEFLKPVRMERTIIATPITSVSAVDRMHTVADEAKYLSVINNYLDTDHYYDINQMPSHEKIVQIIEQNVLNWR